MNIMTYHHLALFICHLFSDGKFRTAHFVYKPSEFDLLLQIDTLCTETMPLYLTDITLPWKWPWNNNDNINNILQMNFLDSNNLEDDVFQLENDRAYYRVYCFASIDAIDSKQQTSTFTTIRNLTNAKSLVVYFNTMHASIFIDSAIANRESNPQLVYVANLDTNYRRSNVFDRTFGEFERTQTIAVPRNKLSHKTQHGVDFDPTF